MAVSADIVRQIADDPAADDRIIGHDQDGDDGVDPAAPCKPALFAKGAESAHRAFSGHAAQCGLGHDHRVAEGDRQQDIDEQENAAAVFGRQIGETPDVAQAHRSTGCRQNKADLAGKGTALGMLRFHDLPSFHKLFAQ